MAPTQLSISPSRAPPSPPLHMHRALWSHCVHISSVHIFLNPFLHAAPNDSVVYLILHYPACRLLSGMCVRVVVPVVLHASAHQMFKQWALEFDQGGSWSSQVCHLLSSVVVRGRPVAAHRLSLLLFVIHWGLIGGNLGVAWAIVRICSLFWYFWLGTMWS